MSQQADAQRLPQDNVGGAFDLPEMEPTAAQPPPAFMEEPAADAAAERAKRRRGWLIVAAAILIPAGLASAVVAIVAMGTTEAPAPAPVAPVAATQPAAAAAPAAEDRPTAVRGSAATDAAGTSGSASSTAAVTSTAAQQSGTATAGDATATAQANAAAEQAAAAPAPLTPAEELAAWTNTITVEVAEGDTLWGFALQYGTTVEAIERLNAISADSLEIGAQITIPISFALDLSAAPVVDEQSAGQVTWRPVETTANGNAFVSVPDPDTPLSAWPNITQVTVAPGDTLDAIAYDYGTSTEAIMVLSGITNPHELYPGDLLSVPVGYSAEVASVAVPEWTPPAAGEEAAAAAGAPATDAATETSSVVLLPVSSGTDASASPAAEGAAPAATAADELVLEGAETSTADELVLEDAEGDELLLAGGNGAETTATDELLLQE